MKYEAHIGSLLRTMREGRNLSQGDMERKTGLLRCYFSRIECGHTVPNIDTLARIVEDGFDMSMSTFFDRLTSEVAR